MSETRGKASGWRGAGGLPLPASGARTSAVGMRHELLAGSLTCVPGFLTGAQFVYLHTYGVLYLQLYLPTPDPVFSPAAWGD